MSRFSCLVLLIALAALSIGCGSKKTDDDHTAPDADSAAIVRVFAALDHVQQTGDAEQACESVYLVAEDQEPAGGDEEHDKDKGEDADADAGREAGESPEACRRAFEAGVATRRAQVERLSTRLGNIEVDGDKATVQVRTSVVRTDGSRFSNVAERDLLKRDGKWRIRISPEG